MTLGFCETAYYGDRSAESEQLHRSSQQHSAPCMHAPQAPVFSFRLGATLIGRPKVVSAAGSLRNQPVSDHRVGAAAVVLCLCCSLQITVPGPHTASVLQVGRSITMNLTPLGPSHPPLNTIGLTSSLTRWAREPGRKWGAWQGHLE
jgi:hypothetical protein